MKLDTRGAADMLLVAAVAVVLVVGGFVILRLQDEADNDKDKKDKAPHSQMVDEADSEETADEREEEAATSSQTIFNGAVSFEVPEGWEVLNNENPDQYFSIQRSVADGTHRIDFQLEAEDFRNEADVGVPQNFEPNEMLTLASGESAYIAKNNDATFDLLSCDPEPTSGCSFQIGEDFMIVSLTKPGVQAVDVLDMASQETADSLADFKELIGTLEIL